LMSVMLKDAGKYCNACQSAVAIIIEGEVIKCESAKVNMYKMRKFDAKDFAFYTSAS